MRTGTSRNARAAPSKTKVTVSTLTSSTSKNIVASLISVLQRIQEAMMPLPRLDTQAHSDFHGLSSRTQSTLGNEVPFQIGREVDICSCHFTPSVVPNAPPFCLYSFSICTSSPPRLQIGPISLYSPTSSSLLFLPLLSLLSPFFNPVVSPDGGEESAVVGCRSPGEERTVAEETTHRTCFCLRCRKVRD
ncbi:hypothetical protein XENOCAPTIV_016997 [Xenoophorus captivus]|uniref:Uncharacterized protein n=1 Tax=Xenoophorus captivus TaxID=1517983 RepID=A0ABV0QVX1_9TELE